MELRTAASPKDFKHYTTERLRDEFLVEKIFFEDDIKLVYSHIDRIIFGGAMPVTKKLALTAGDELRVEYFLQRRELIDLNKMMLEKGAPYVTGKDEVGYNITDFNRMYWTSIIPDEKVTEPIVIEMIEVLSHYRATQLPDIDDLIKYKDECLKNIADENGICKSEALTNNKEEVKVEKEKFKKTLRIFDTFEDSLIILENLGYDPALNDFIHTTDTIRNKKIDGEWHVVIVRCKNELELLNGFEKLGYCTDAVKDYILSHKVDWEKADDAKKVTDKATVMTATDDYIAVRFSKRNDVISKFIYQNKIFGRWSKNKKDDEWDFLLNISMADRFCEKLEENNIDADEIRKLIKKEDREEIKPVEPENAPYKPYQFQLDDVAEMLKKRKMILGNEMGCGKTHECVRVGYSLKMNKLVICPPSLRIN